jgi:SAM-dependent methyltransferase
MQPDQAIERNKDALWLVEPSSGHVFTYMPFEKEFLVLNGLDGILWQALSSPCNIAQLEEKLKASAMQFFVVADFKERIAAMIQKGLIYAKPIIGENGIVSVVPQKYKDRYLTLLRELRSAEDFSSAFDLKEFHRKNIHTSLGHFEDIEITVSHLYRQPHAALGYLSFGERLFEKLNSLKTITSDNIVVEVGGGLGYVASSFLGYFNRNYGPGLKYIFCDLTLKFVESQKSLNKEHNIFYCQGNAEELPFKDSSIDLLIDNENIADFTAVKLNKKLVFDFLDGRLDSNSVCDRLVRRSLEWIRFGNIDVSDALPEFIFNLGAIEFVNEVKRVLVPGGLAYICEYGIMNGYPSAVNLVGHVEYNIQFTHLIRIIEAMGMKVQVYSLIDFLGFNTEIKVIDSASLEFIANLLKTKNTELPYLAYTKSELEDKFPDLLKNPQNLQFNSIKQHSVYHDLNVFYVLVVTK